MCISKKSKKVLIRTLIALLPAVLWMHAGYAQESPVLTLATVIEQALGQDDWLVANTFREQALREEAVFAGELPDPRMVVSMMNLPINTLNFDQEPMTQFRVGINQSFPRGDTRALNQQQKLQQSEVNPYLREERGASVELQVTRLWLDSFLAQETIALINDDRDLFEQLVDLTDSRYRNAAGLARQQDVVRAQVELTRLDDRLAALRQKLDGSKQLLAQWIPYELVSLRIAEILPEYATPDIELTDLAAASAFFSKHPKIKAADKQIESSLTSVELAKQNYKPGFSLGANYGYRDDGPMGLQRDDFISLEVSFDLPLFTEKRQKPKVEAASYRASSLQTERLLIFRNLFATWQQAISQLSVIEERRALYNETLLAQITDLTEATLGAYTADEGDFAEVMRAYIAELNARIEMLGIDTERLKMLAWLKYLSTVSTN
jgi:outer membrane protein TolC